MFMLESHGNISIIQYVNYTIVVWTCMWYIIGSHYVEKKYFIRGINLLFIEVSINNYKFKKLFIYLNYK